MIAGVLLVGVCAAFVGPEGEEAVKKELERFAGVWSFQLVEVDGEKQPDMPFESNRMILSPDGSFAVVQGPRVTRGTIKPDPSKSPKQYGYEIGTGPVKGLTGVNLYELEGDDLRLCMSIQPGQVPASMTSEPGCGCIYQVFRRESKDVKEALVDAGVTELAGEWVAVRQMAAHGTQAPDAAQAQSLTIVAAGRTFTISTGDKSRAGTFIVDTTQDPMTFDVTYTEGEMNGQSALGIYRIEGDTMTVCRGLPGQPRPSEFASTSETELTSYTRVKAATP